MPEKKVKNYTIYGVRSIQHNILSNFTIGIDGIDKMIDKMTQYSLANIYKIKLGTDQDIEIIRELRLHIAMLIFRIDANCAWNADQTLDYAPELKKLRRRIFRTTTPCR